MTIRFVSKPSSNARNVETRELTILVDSQAELRSLASFLTMLAKLPRSKWMEFGHEHYRDTKWHRKNAPDMIVVRPRGADDSRVKVDQVVI